MTMTVSEILAHPHPIPPLKGEGVIGVRHCRATLPLEGRGRGWGFLDALSAAWRHADA